MTPSESTLLDRCRRGDELAWEALVRAHQGRVYGLAYHYLGEAEEARDLAQEVFIRIYRHRDAWPEGGFVPWLVRVTRNACIDQLRRRRVRPQADISVEEMVELAAGDPDPQEMLAHGRRRDLVRRALWSMSLLNREVLVLHVMEELSFEEIASLLDVPVGTVKSRTNRARLELAKRVLALEAGLSPASSS